jgi:hypothetical protein
MVVNREKAETVMCVDMNFYRMTSPPPIHAKCFLPRAKTLMKLVTLLGVQMCECAQPYASTAPLVESVISILGSTTDRPSPC